MSSQKNKLITFPNPIFLMLNLETMKQNFFKTMRLLSLAFVLALCTMCDVDLVFEQTDMVCDTTNNELQYDFFVSGGTPNYSLSISTSPPEGNPIITPASTTGAFEVTFDQPFSAGTVATITAIDADDCEETYTFMPDGECLGDPCPVILQQGDEICQNDTLTYTFEIIGGTPPYTLVEVITNTGEGNPVFIDADPMDNLFQVEFSEFFSTGTIATIIVEDANGCASEFSFEPDAECIPGICIADAGDLENQRIHFDKIDNDIVGLRNSIYPSTATLWLLFVANNDGRIKYAEMHTNPSNPTQFIPIISGGYTMYKYVEITNGTTYLRDGTTQGSATTTNIRGQLIENVLPTAPPSEETCYHYITREKCILKFDYTKCLEGATTGRIDQDIADNICDLQYAWNTGDNSTSIDGLGAGIYTLTVTDTEETKIIDFELHPPMSAYASTDSSCNIIIEIINGEAPYTYVVEGDNGYMEENETTQSFFELIGLGLGASYAITVTDSNGCEWTTLEECM